MVRRTRTTTRTTDALPRSHSLPMPACGAWRARCCVWIGRPITCSRQRGPRSPRLPRPGVMLSCQRAHAAAECFKPPRRTTDHRVPRPPGNSLASRQANRAARRHAGSPRSSRPVLCRGPAPTHSHRSSQIFMVAEDAIKFVRCPLLAALNRGPPSRCDSERRKITAAAATACRTGLARRWGPRPVR